MFCLKKIMRKTGLDAVFRFFYTESRKKAEVFS